MLVSTRTGPSSRRPRPGEAACAGASFSSRRVVDLVQQIEVLVLAEDVRDVRHPLHAVAVERVGGVLVLGRRALAGEHD